MCVEAQIAKKQKFLIKIQYLGIADLESCIWHINCINKVLKVSKTFSSFIFPCRWVHIEGEYIKYSVRPLQNIVIGILSKNLHIYGKWDL